MAAPGTYRESLGKRIWQAKYSYLMLAPFTILFVLFTVLPVAIAIWFSFTNYDMLHNASFTGLENYMRMFLDDDVFLIALKNTLICARWRRWCFMHRCFQAACSPSGSSSSARTGTGCSTAS